MKTKTPKSLSRAEVARRLQTLSVDPWRNLSGNIDGVSVNAWATGKNKRIDRISVCALPSKSRASDALRVAKHINDLTSLTVHWHGADLGGVIQPGGSVIRYPSANYPLRKLP